MTADWNAACSAIHETSGYSSVKRDRDKTDADSGVFVETL